MKNSISFEVEFFFIIGQGSVKTHLKTHSRLGETKQKTKEKLDLPSFLPYIWSLNIRLLKQKIIINIVFTKTLML